MYNSSKMHDNNDNIAWGNTFSLFCIRLFCATTTKRKLNKFFELVNPVFFDVHSSPPTHPLTLCIGERMQCEEKVSHFLDQESIL